MPINIVLDDLIDAPLQAPVPPATFWEYATPGRTLFENRKAFQGLQQWTYVSIMGKDWLFLPDNKKLLWESRAASEEGKWELACYKQGCYMNFSKFLKSLPKKKIRIINREGEFEV